MLDETHSAVSRPASLGVESDDVLVVGIRVGGEVSLDEIPRLVGLESEEDVDPIDVTSLRGEGGDEQRAKSPLALVQAMKRRGNSRRVEWDASSPSRYLGTGGSCWGAEEDRPSHWLVGDQE